MTTDYKTVFQLAQEKGFRSQIESIDYRAIPDNETLTLLFATQIQKWLRDEHKIQVEVRNQFEILNDGAWFYPVIYAQSLPLSRAAFSTGVNCSYQTALLNGINEALKLI